MTICSEQFDLQSFRGSLVITGATGWVGRTALQELYHLFPAPFVAERVKLFASRAGSLSIAGLSHPVYPLQALPELAASEPLTALFHAAFLTRDRLDSVGFDRYVSTNRWITAQVVEALSYAPSARAVVISSGAASAVAESDLVDHEQLIQDPYGVLKREEETRISGSVSSLVLRIYALSGRFIRDAHRFALGDFLLAALCRQSISVRASMPVLRGYGHAGDIAALAWRWLFAGSPTPADPLPAVSVITDLLSLAQRISTLYELPPVRAVINPQLAPHRYVADPAPFLAALAVHGLVPMSLDQQIRDTAAGLTVPTVGNLM